MDPDKREPVTASEVALLVAATYLVAGAFWLAVTDDRMSLLARIPWVGAAIQAIEGWLFLLGTAIVLFFLLARARESGIVAHGRLGAVVAASPLAIVDLDTEGCVVGWNRAAEELFGHPEHEVVGAPPPVDLGAPGEDGGAPVELTFLRRDGSRAVMTTASAVVRDSEGRPIGAVHVAADVTERHRMEAELVAAEERFRQLAENVQEVFWIVSADLDEVVYVSPAAYKLYGVPPERISEDPETLLTLMVEEDRDELVDVFLRGPSHPFEVDHRVRRPDGSIRWVRTRGFPVRDGEGRIYRIAGVSADVTLQREAQDKAREQSAELERRVAERTAQLRSINQELEAFSYSVSHDLQGPLQTIDGFSMILLEDKVDQLDEEARDLLTRVRGASQRMEGLLDALLGLSRITRRELRREEVDLSAIAEIVVNELSLREPDRVVHVTIEPGLGARGDPALLQVLMTNLVGNAWKFSRYEDEATIHVGRRDERGRMVYFVQDDGVGFPMEQADKLFQAFHRLHAEEEFEGTGIGLATAQRIVLRHGGRIWAEGEPGKGARVSFTLEAGR